MQKATRHYESACQMDAEEENESDMKKIQERSRKLFSELASETEKQASYDKYEIR